MTDAHAASEATSKTGSISPAEKEAILAQRGSETTETTQSTTTSDADYQLSAEKMMMDNLFILGMLFFIFYFILIRPQQKRLQQHKNMMKTLAKGNKILTSGGIIGNIHKFEGEDVVVVEVAQGIKIRMSRAAITEVLSDKASAESANDN